MHDRKVSDVELAWNYYQLRPGPYEAQFNEVFRRVILTIDIKRRADLMLLHCLASVSCDQRIDSGRGLSMDKGLSTLYPSMTARGHNDLNEKRQNLSVRPAGTISSQSGSQ